MFWGKERKEALHTCIFGDPNIVSHYSKTLINRLYNMITLSPNLHARWGLGHFSLEPLTAESTALRLQWTPNYQPTDGVTTVDPIRTPLPSLELLNLQCHLSRVLRMAGRAGGDMLETIESDSDI